MKIIDILNRAVCTDVRLELNCHLFAANGKVYLLDDHENVDLNQALDISSSWVWDTIRGFLPSYGGGEWEYMETCHVSLIVKSPLEDLEIDVLKIDISSRNLTYLIDPDFNYDEVSANTFKMDELCSVKQDISIKELAGFLILKEDESVTLNSMEDVEAEPNFSLPVISPNVAEVIDLHFLPSDDWPEYKALVKINAKIVTTESGQMAISDIIDWQIIYPSVRICFSGIGNCEYYLDESA